MKVANKIYPNKEGVMQKFKTGKKAVKSLSAVAVALAMGTGVFAGTVFASAAGDDAATASQLPYLA